MKASSAIRKNSSAASTNMQKIGRPINCFLAFRLEKHREISSQSPGLNHRDISKIIAKWWRGATDSEKAPYRAIADKAKAAHAKKYPDYKYKPVKKSEHKVRPYHRREDAITRERKSKAQKQLLKQWLGEDDYEDKDNKSVASFYSSDSSSSSSSSSPYYYGSNSCNANTQPFFEDMPIKQEAIQQNELNFFSPSSLCQPVFYDEPIYDFDINPSDSISGCACFTSSQISPMDTNTNFSSLNYYDTPHDYVNLQMLSLNYSTFML